MYALKRAKGGGVGKRVTSGAKHEVAFVRRNGAGKHGVWKQRCGGGDKEGGVGVA